MQLQQSLKQAFNAERMTGEIGIEQTFIFGEEQKPLNMILDDGGDLTNMVLDNFPNLVDDIRGLSEIHCVHRLYEK